MLASELERYLADRVARDAFSGVVLVAQDDVPIFTRAYGLAHKGYQIANHEDTKYNIGSLTKMFTALAVVQLAAHGSLIFDTPLSAYLPNYPRPLANKITLHHLLTHTSGMVESILNTETFWLHKDQPPTTDDWLARVVDLPLLCELGSAWSYSNAGFVVLGAVIEQSTGMSYFDYVRKHVWQASGMHNTDGYALDEDVPMRATGYMEPADTPNGSQTRRNSLPFSLLRGSAHGGAYSTAPDLLRFATALQQHTLLDLEHTNILLSSKVVTKRRAGEHYAYGFFREEREKHVIVGHGGAVAGFNAWFDVYFDRGYSVIVLANYSAPTAQNVGEKLRQLILAQVH